MRSASELRFKTPIIDHSYHIKATYKITNSKSKTYLDQVQAQARVCSADPAKYSKIQDWSQNKGQMIPKEKKETYIDKIMQQKKQIPAPNKYQSWIKPRVKGCVKLKSSKCSILDSIAFEKKAIPGPNKYDYFKGLAQVSKERNIPRLRKSESAEGTIRIKKRQLVTPAPGGKLNDKTLDVNRKSTTMIKFSKAQNQTLIQS